MHLGPGADKKHYFMFNKTQIKAEYEAPQVEILEARVERGFQVSGSPAPETSNGTEGLGERSTAMFS